MSLTGLTKIKSVILALVIAIVLASLVGYAINVFDEVPELQDYCGDKGLNRLSPVENPKQETQESCEANEGAKWENNYCDFYYQCQMNYDAAREKHSRIVFLVSVPAGVIALSVGIALGLPSVSSGLMLGGVFLVFYGTISYWDNFSDIMRVVILAIALGLLIWLGYKKLEH